MGTQCGCSRYLDPETFIKEVLSSTCLLNLTASDITQILLLRIRGGNDLVLKTNLEITEDTYLEIAQDISDKRYFKSKKDPIIKGKDTFVDITAQFLLKLYPLLDVNNHINCLLFKLLMCPFTLKANEEFDKKAKHLYVCLKCVSFKGSDIDLVKDDIEYSAFCENFITYLAMVLSGFTKIIRESLHENNSDELMRSEMDENLNKVFQAEMIKEYYAYLTREFIKRIESVDSESNIENYRVTKDDFCFLCKEHEEILDYFSLREDYISFSRRKLNSLILTEK